MNKKYQKLVLICNIFAVVLVIAAAFCMCKPKIDEYSSFLNEIKAHNQEKADLQQQIQMDEQRKNKEKLDLLNLKPIYKSEISNSTESLGVFGSMFEEIIIKAQSNGLLIRSIEYNTKPADDPVYSAYNNFYNACELKFFFIGTYAQMQAFLNDMTNNFEYLTFISSLDISAFSENDNYLLIKESITLYSEKTNEDKKKS